MRSGQRGRRWHPDSEALAVLPSPRVTQTTTLPIPLSLRQHAFFELYAFNVAFRPSSHLQYQHPCKNFYKHLQDARGWRESWPLPSEDSHACRTINRVYQTIVALSTYAVAAVCSKVMTLTTSFLETKASEALPKTLKKKAYPAILAPPPQHGAWIDLLQTTRHPSPMLSSYHYSRRSSSKPILPPGPVAKISQGEDAQTTPIQNLRQLHAHFPPLVRRPKCRAAEVGDRGCHPNWLNVHSDTSIIHRSQPGSLIVLIFGTRVS